MTSSETRIVALAMLIKLTEDNGCVTIINLLAGKWAVAIIGCCNAFMIQKKVYTREQALQKIRHYCSYQERCHSEVKEKLYGMGLHKQVVEELISDLIETNYLNEERFAIQFAGGKFRMNHWGKTKIVYALKQKRVSEYCIKKAMKEIDGEDYEERLTKLAATKWLVLKGANNITRQAKTYAYLLQKGYEAAKIGPVINRLKNDDKE